MLERILTAQNGVIPKLLESNFTWHRIHDAGRKNVHKKKIDGFLLFREFGCPVEVKIGNARLTSTEQEYRKLLTSCGHYHMTLRAFIIKEHSTAHKSEILWSADVMDVLNENYNINTALRKAFRWIEQKVARDLEALNGRK